VARIALSASGQGFQRSSQGVPPLQFTSGQDPMFTASHPLSACCNVSKKANAASISNARLVYWLHTCQPAKRKQLCLTSATCRGAPRAGCGSHRPFGRHQIACPSLTDALHAPDEAVSWTPTLIMAVSTVAGLFRRLKYLSTCTILGNLPNTNHPLTYSFRSSFQRSAYSLSKVPLLSTRLC
jgi:hypothetical protein